MDEAAIVPENPALHEQPEATLVPAEFVGHDTATHRPVGAGDHVSPCAVVVQVIVDTALLTLYPLAQILETVRMAK